MKNCLHVFRKISRSGVEIKIKRKKFKVNYPIQIWNKFPKSLHKVFADSLAYVCTWHLPLIEDSNITYHFSHPPIEPLFFKLLLYSIPMSIFEKEGTKTSEILKKFYNTNFQSRFKALNCSYSGKKIKQNLKNKAMLFFSFGKDSLLTYCLLKEFKINQTLFFVEVPNCQIENRQKSKLTEKFFEKTGDEINFFPLSIGKIRQDVDLSWGWDIILSQYVFILLPYYFYYLPKYLFFGNEQSCNFYIEDEENYLINPVYEQSVPAMQLLQDIPRLFFVNAHIGSLLEPVHEIFITYILHYRYPEIGRFQTSCLLEEESAKEKRWCGKCDKCAMMYIFFKALSINPEKVGFLDKQMLSFKKSHLYILFNKKSIKEGTGRSGLTRDEQLLAFYLAYKNGAKGDLITKFKSLYLKEAEKRKDKLIKEYFGIHSSFSLPSALRKRTLNIYVKEREKALHYVQKIVGR